MSISLRETAYADHPDGDRLPHCKGEHARECFRAHSNLYSWVIAVQRVYDWEEEASAWWAMNALRNSAPPESTLRSRVTA